MPGFVDGAWATAVVVATGGIWAENPARNDAEQALFRAHFTLATTPVLAATLTITTQGTALAAYINGTALSGSFPTAPGVAQTLTIPPSILVLGGDNVLACWCDATGHVATIPNIAYSLVVTT